MRWWSNGYDSGLPSRDESRLSGFELLNVSIRHACPGRRIFIGKI